jgi:D-threonine aldolase
MIAEWLRVTNEAEIPSPSLLIFADRVEENLRRMIAIAGSPARLRPHIKTHKLAPVLALQVAMGITKCKCATIAEAELAARAGATDVLLAMQLVGPNLARWIALIRAFPQVAFSALVDDPPALAHYSRAAVAAGATLELLLDLDVGQQRTGIAPGSAALALYRELAASPGVRAGGLHAYDGHLHQSDLAERTRAAGAAFARVSALHAQLRGEGMPVPRVVCGGTPTFAIHAQRQEVECSPGTCVLWDAGYARKLPDLDFLHAAVLLTRVISRPAPNRLCLDLGHKAVASEMPQPRVIFPALPDAVPGAHSEEHLVLETGRAAEFPVGSALYGVPWHVCPTVALHETVHVVRENHVTEEWRVEGRTRRLTF